MRQVASSSTRGDVVFAIVEANNDLGEVQISHYPSVFLFSKGEHPKSHIDLVQTRTSEALAAEVQQLTTNIDWVSTGEDEANDEL